MCARHLAPFGAAPGAAMAAGVRQTPPPENPSTDPMSKKPITPLRAAIEKPLPAALAAAVAKAKAATAAFHTARGAIDEHRRTQHVDNISAIETQMAEVEARVNVAKYLGEPANADDLEKVEALRVELHNAVTRRNSRKALEAGLVKAIDARREAVDVAEVELGQILDDWRDDVLAAADGQIAEAVRLIGEAQGVASELKPAMDFGEPISVPRISLPGRHQAERVCDLPDEVVAALDAWSRAYRVGARI